MKTTELAAEINKFLSTTELKNIADERGKRWLHIPGHMPYVIPARQDKPHWLDIRLQARPNTDFHEEPITLLLSYLIARFKPGIFFDIGAARGHFSLVAATHEQFAPQVHAFDMRPEALEELQKLADQKIPGRIAAHLCGLSDLHQGTKRIWYARFKMFEHEPEPHEYLEPWYIRLKFALRGREKSQSRNLRRADVLLTSIDAFCADNGIAPGLMKIDVDGYEGKVIQGAKETLQKDQPIILLELHRDSMQRFNLMRKDVTEMLFKAGYQAIFITDHHKKCSTKLEPVDSNSPLLTRAETDMVLFMPPRCLDDN